MISLKHIASKGQANIFSVITKINVEGIQSSFNPFCDQWDMHVPLTNSLFNSAGITVSHYFPMLPSNLKYLYSVEPVRMHFPAKHPCTNDTVCNAAMQHCTQYHSAQVEKEIFLKLCTGRSLTESYNTRCCINPLNPELNPICYLLTLLAHHFLHVSRIMVKSLTLRLLMSYIYWRAYS